jgi:class 3 adenylate cyclase
MDFTAIGTTANRGARLEAAAKPGLPCIDFTTYNTVLTRFLYAPDSPRQIELKGLGIEQVWDVVGRA